MPLTTKGSPIVTVTPERFIVKLFKTAPPAKNKAVAEKVPLPAMLKFDVEVPINLPPFVMVTIPFKASVFPAPIEIIPNGCVPPAIVVVPVAVTEEDSVTEGAANVPAGVVFEKFKLLIVAGIKLPVTCATEPLKVKLVLLLAPLVKLVVVVANVPFTPVALAVIKVEPDVAPLPNIFTVPVPLITELDGAVRIEEVVAVTPTLNVPGLVMVIVVPAFNVRPVLVLASVTEPVIAPVVPGFVGAIASPIA